MKININHLISLNHYIFILPHSCFSLLLGPRVESRPMERFFKFICTPFAAAFPTAFSVHVDVLARAMANVAASPPADSVHVLDNKAIHKAANAPSWRNVLFLKRKGF